MPRVGFGDFFWGYFTVPYASAPRSLPNEHQFRAGDVRNGAIIILDIPVMGDNKELAQLAQVVFKMLWYRAMERRDISANPRPVFLLSDEHQYLYSTHDQVFLTTARSLRVSCTLITQNISNFYAILPGDKGRAETDSLFANCGTIFCHMQTDSVTNNWMATRIGSTRQWFQGVSTCCPQPSNLYSRPWGASVIPPASPH